MATPSAFSCLSVLLEMKIKVVFHTLLSSFSRREAQSALFALYWETII
jgi:hypothetical protein